MKKILVVGGGAMGSAFTIPCLENNNKVTITEPYSKIFIKNLSSKNKFHSALKINLPKKLKFRKFSNGLLKEKFDLIVIALSLSGIDFIGKQLKNLKIKTPVLVLTKGLKYEKKNRKILTISEQLKKNYNISNVSILKGPCLAKELARKNQTSVIVANKNINKAKQIGKMISTKYYLTEFSRDIIGVEVCSAIKNIFSMAVGAAKGLCSNNITEEIREKNYLNTASVLIKQSVQEMEIFVEHLKGKRETVKGLAGLGDLYVSSGGGRNSLMGSYIGQGMIFSDAKKNKMLKVTVEGADLAIEIGKKVNEDFSKKKLPLMLGMINAILEDKKFELDWQYFN